MIFRSSQNLPHVLNGYDGMIFLQCIWVNYLVGGIPTPMKNMKVSWDDDIPNTIMETFFFKNPNHQPVMILGIDNWD